MSAKPLDEPLPGDKTFRLEQEIRFYTIEDSHETEKGEESEILVVYNLSLAASKQKLVKKQFPYIDTFDHKGPVIIDAMRNITTGVVEQLDITSPMFVDKRLANTQRILRGAAL